MEEVRKLSLERGEGQLPSKCAIFVCNKWDQVPEEEHNEVKSHVVQKLQRCWPGLDPETQIIYMSTKNATKAQKMGIITNEFSSFMETVQMMVLRSIQCQLEIHWRYSWKLRSLFKKTQLRYKIGYCSLSTAAKRFSFRIERRNLI